MSPAPTAGADAVVRDLVALEIVAVGHIVPGGAAAVSDRAVMAHVGRPSVFNRATALDLTQPDVTLSEVQRFFAGLPHTLWLEDVHPDLDALLVGRGYAAMPARTGMVSDALPTDPGGAHVELVADTAVAPELAAVAAGSGEPDDRLTFEDFLRGVLRHARPFDHGAVYAIRDGGRVVAMGLLLCTAHTAGLTYLATLPDHRRRGLATAVARRALHDAAALGYGLAAALATTEACGLLERLGWRSATTVTPYRWEPR